VRYTVHKMFFVWDYEKEELWLNEMSAKGMLLTGVGFGSYVFEEGEPGAYVYHLEWLRHAPTHAESVAYIRFLEELGVEHVASFKHWVYFRKKAADGPFELFSDLDSRISHFQRLMALMYAIFAVWAAGAAYEAALFLGNRGFTPVFPITVSAYFGALLILLLLGYAKIRAAYGRLARERRLRE